MSFTYNRTDFVDQRDYNEEEHATALQNGIPDFCKRGFEIVNGAVKNGTGINNGVPFQLGKEGEVYDIAGFSGFVVVKTVLNSLSSITSLEKLTTVPESTATVKYFKLYDVTNGVSTQDYRHIDYIKDFRIIPTGNQDEIAFILNGYKTDPFNVSVLAGQDDVINLQDLAISDNSFSGLNTDGCFQVIHNIAKQFAPCVVMDRITSGNFPNLRQAIFNDPRFFLNADFNHDPHFVMEIIGNNQSIGGFLKFGYDNQNKTQDFKFDNEFVPGSDGYGGFVQTFDPVRRDLESINLGLNESVSFPGIVDHPVRMGYKSSAIILNDSTIISIPLVTEDTRLIYSQNEPYVGGENGMTWYGYILVWSSPNIFTLERAAAKSISDNQTIANVVRPSITKIIFK